MASYNIRKIFLWSFAVLLAIFIIIQFIPVDRSNPAVIKEPVWDSPATRAIAVRSCFDCHSNQTRWPSYAYVAPFSWLMAAHVSEGREMLNFSDWKASYEFEEVEEEVSRGKMPLRSYLMLHPAAKLTENDKKELLRGLKKTFVLSGNLK